MTKAGEFAFGGANIASSARVNSVAVQIKWDYLDIKYHFEEKKLQSEEQQIINWRCESRGLVTRNQTNRVKMGFRR